MLDSDAQNGLRLMRSVLLRICNLDPEVEKEKEEMERRFIEAM